MRDLIVIACIAFIVGGFGGWYATSDHYEAKQAKALKDAMEKYVADVERGNKSSGNLAKQESAINAKTVEVIKYVPSVTTGRQCLDAGAVRLLNNGATPKLSETAGEPATESPSTSAASDTDVAEWIAAASGQYETCAARLNELVDYEEGRP